MNCSELSCHNVLVVGLLDMHLSFGLGSRASHSGPDPLMEQCLSCLSWSLLSLLGLVNDDWTSAESSFEKNPTEVLSGRSLYSMGTWAQIPASILFNLKHSWTHQRSWKHTYKPGKIAKQLWFLSTIHTVQSDQWIQCFLSYGAWGLWVKFPS